MLYNKNNFNTVIFIVADTLRADKVGLYGENLELTPNINQIGKEGIVFNNAYTTVTNTDPSITSMMTGKYPVSVGLINHASRIQDSELKNIEACKFLPEILGKEKYKTIAIDWMGRWHKRGYKIYSGKIERKSKKNRHSDSPPLFSFLRYFGKLSFYLFSRELSLRLYYAFAKSPYIPYDSASVVIPKAIEILKKCKKEKLFLYIHLWDCHAPHTQSKGIHSYLFDTIEKTYEGQVKYLDEQIGKLYKYLKRSGMDKNTLLIFTSDHGENFSGPGKLLCHEGLTEDIVRIPLIINSPHLPKKQLTNLVQHIDIFPTILDLLHIPLRDEIDGKSLLPNILGRKNRIRSFAYFEDLGINRTNIKKSTRRRGIRLKDYKYIQTIKSSKELLSSVELPKDIRIDSEELYDLNNDVNEKNNLITKKKKIACELSLELQKIIEKLEKQRLNEQQMIRKKNKDGINDKQEILSILQSLGY